VLHVTKQPDEMTY